MELAILLGLIGLALIADDVIRERRMRELADGYAWDDFVAEMRALTREDEQLGRTLSGRYIPPPQRGYVASPAQERHWNDA